MFQASSGTPAAAQPAATATNMLGMDLLQKLAVPHGNVLLAPYSIQIGLAMAYAGADGVTREEMARVLHYPRDEASLHESFAILRNKFEEASKVPRRRSAAGDPLRLTVANRLFGQAGFRFHQTFLSLLSNTYAAPFEALDFAKDSALATRKINAWVETETRQRIRDLVPPNTLDKLTRLVVLNAIHLSAPWRAPFEPSNTRPGSFYVNGTERVEVPMMHQRQELAFAQGDTYVAVCLPLAHPFQFQIFLPVKPDGLAELEEQFSAVLPFREIRWEARRGSLFLPRLKLQPPALSLSSALQALGMKTAFDIPPESANFARIGSHDPGDNLRLSEVFSKTMLNLDEKGVEVTAATATSSRTSAWCDPVEVRVSHPFLFAVVAHLSVEANGAVCLFLGHVSDPR